MVEQDNRLFFAIACESGIHNATAGLRLVDLRLKPFFGQIFFPEVGSCGLVAGRIYLYQPGYNGSAVGQLPAQSRPNLVEQQLLEDAPGAEK